MTLFGIYNKLHVSAIAFLAVGPKLFHKNRIKKSNNSESLSNGRQTVVFRRNHDANHIQRSIVVAY